MRLRLAAALLSAAPLLFAAAAATAITPQPGRYKGKALLEIVAADNLSARQRFEVVGILSDSGILQVFFPSIPPLPFWETREPDGILMTSAGDASWTAHTNNDATPQTLIGKATASSIQLGYDAGLLDEAGAIGPAHVFLSFKMKRVGP